MALGELIVLAYTGRQPLDVRASSVQPAKAGGLSVQTIVSYTARRHRAGSKPVRWRRPFYTGRKLAETAYSVKQAHTIGSPPTNII